MPSWLQKNYLGSLLKIKIGPHPLTFPCRSKVGLKNVFFFLKISNAQHKRCRRLYGKKQLSLSIVHPFPVSFPEAATFTNFLHVVADLESACIYRHACVVGWEVGVYYTDCSAPGFCCFPAYLKDLSLSLPTELRHSFEGLPPSSL